MVSQSISMKKFFRRKDIQAGYLCKDPHFPNSVILITEVVLDTTYSDVERYYVRYISSSGKTMGTAWGHSLKVLSK